MATPDEIKNYCEGLRGELRRSLMEFSGLLANASRLKFDPAAETGRFEEFVQNFIAPLERELLKNAHKIDIEKLEKLPFLEIVKSARDLMHGDVESAQKRLAQIYKEIIRITTES